MTEPQVTWRPGPGPAPTGLDAAFELATRRRRRTALLASVSVLPVVVLVAALVSSQARSDSLVIRPAETGRPQPTVTTSPPAAATSPTTLPGTRPTAGPPPGAPVAGSPAVPVPAAPRPAAAPGQLVLHASRSAQTTLVLRRTVHPQLSGVTFASDGTYAAVYLTSADRSVVAGALRVTVPGEPVRDYSLGTAAALPPGRYTVFVLGDAVTDVRLPLAKGEHGVTLTATTPATAAFHKVGRDFAVPAASADVRLHLPAGARLTGIAGARITVQGGQASPAVSACITRPDAACAGGDRQSSQSSGVTVDGGFGVTVPLPVGSLSGARDVLGHGEAAAAGKATVAAWYFVFDNRPAG
jgi:hypothetical protein